QALLRYLLDKDD
nr:Chain D, Transcriptional mediator/intermediary factor 2 [synthetic construct]7RAF_D Chain D, Transcriptional mediator/intermediary factor 2 [Escherichia phage EcSzw-2]